MTATTKEQRDTFARLLAECDGDTTDESAFVMYADEVLPALLSDSERLAAIEAVTGEDVRELVPELRRRGDGFCVNVKAAMPDAKPNPIEYRAADALLSLSAKVAEQAEEIERLWIAMKTGASALRRAQEMHDAAADERDALRRLLTEMAVPALEVADRALGHAKHRIPQTVVFDALSTIRAHMEGGDD